MTITRMPDGAARPQSITGGKVLFSEKKEQGGAKSAGAKPRTDRLELSAPVDAAGEKMKEKIQAIQGDLLTIQAAQHDAAVARQQGEAMGETFDDLAKMLEIARRISSGGRVPSQDEQKLLEYSKELYMMAKSAAAMAKSEEKYDSLIKDKPETDQAELPDMPATALPEIALPEMAEGE